MASSFGKMQIAWLAGLLLVFAACSAMAFEPPVRWQTVDLSRPPASSRLLPADGIPVRLIQEGELEREEMFPEFGMPTDDEPDIEEPGLDMGNFPNSAWTLKKGRAYIENAPLTLVEKSTANPAGYAWQYLIRYGLTDDVELRFLGNGLTSTFGDNGTTGFSPLIADLKIHCWDERREWLLPAVALEVYVQTDWASPAFRGGTQPSLNLNFDLTVTERTNLEWTIGYTGMQETVTTVAGERLVGPNQIPVPILQQVTLNEYQFSIQWAIEQRIGERLTVFVHGYDNGAVAFQPGSGSVIGLGGFWACSRRLMLFGSGNVGTSGDASPDSVQFGFGWAL